MSESDSSRNENESLGDVLQSSVADGANDASAMLRSGREKMGLSQKEVAERLYLTERFIRHIDEGALDKIAKPAFIKGYLRSYARLVNVSGDEVVEKYQQSLDAAEEAIQLRSVTEDSLGSSNFTGPVIQTGLAGLAGLLLFIGFIWWLVADDVEETPPSVQTVPAVEEAARRMPSAPLLEEQVVVERPAADADVAPLTGDTVVNQPEEQGLPKQVRQQGQEEAAQQEPPVAMPRPAANEPAVQGEGVTIDRAATPRGASQVTVNADGDDRIEMTFTDECWVEITDASGMSIYGDLNREGDLLVVNGVAPFQVLLGRAASVSMRFNGEAVELGAYTTTDQTARVRLEN